MSYFIVGELFKWKGVWFRVAKISPDGLFLQVEGEEADGTQKKLWPLQPSGLKEAPNSSHGLHEGP